MSNLDEMTAAELLEHARSLGVSPANKNMTKDELRAAIDQHEGGTPEQFVTTTRTKDYMARLLYNPVPGTSNATDFLGRSVVAGDRDYMNRVLVT